MPSTNCSCDTTRDPRRVALGVKGTGFPPVDPPWCRDLAPHAAVSSSDPRIWEHPFLLHLRQEALITKGHGHNHQLFHLLRGRENSTKWRSVRAGDLGHRDLLLRVVRESLLHHSLQDSVLHSAQPGQAAQVHRESAPREQTPRCAPLCAAEPVPAALAALVSWQATYPTRRLPRRTAGRTPRPWPHWSSAYSSWPPWSLPSSVSCGASCFSCLPNPLNFGGS